MQHRGGKAGLVDSGCRDRSRRRATRREHHQHRLRSLLPLAGPGKTWGDKACCPSGHGGVSGAPNGDGRGTNGEGASDAGDCHAGERCKEWGRAARPVTGKEIGRQPDERALEKGVDGYMSSHAVWDWTNKYEGVGCGLGRDGRIRQRNDLFFLFESAPGEPCSDVESRTDALQVVFP
jgi:hypothetical protein